MAGVAASPAAATGVAARPGQLGHEGRWYTDEDGRVRVLHGLNVVAKRAPYLPSAIGIGDDDAAFMARQGFNTIRLGVIYTAVEPRPGVYDDRYLAGIARTVRIFRRHGIYSLLDFHQDQYNERFEGQGFPDWAVLDDGLEAEPKLRLPAQLLPDARPPADLRQLLAQPAWTRRGEGANPLRGGMATRGRSLPRPAGRDGVRPDERALRGQRPSRLPVGGRLPAVRAAARCRLSRGGCSGQSEASIAPASSITSPRSASGSSAPHPPSTGPSGTPPSRSRGTCTASKG